MGLEIYVKYRWIFYIEFYKIWSRDLTLSGSSWQFLIYDLASIFTQKLRSTSVRLRFALWSIQLKKKLFTRPVPLSTHTSDQCVLYNSKWGIVHLRYLKTFWQKKNSFRFRSSTVLLHAKGSNFSCNKLQSIAYLSFKALSWLALILSTSTFVSTLCLWLHALKVVPATFHTGYVLH